MKITVYKKIMLGFGAIIAIVIISSAYTLFEFTTVSKGAENILTSNVQTLEMARQLQALVRDEIEFSEKYFILRDETYLSLFVKTSKQVDRKLNLLADKKLSDKVKSRVQVMQNAHRIFVAEILKTDNKEILQTDNRGIIRQKNRRSLFSSLNDLITENQSFIGQEVERIEVVTRRTIDFALVIISWTLCIALLAASFIAKTITRPIKTLIKGTEQIAIGNFDKIHVDSRDEISLLAHAINDMSTKIEGTNELRSQMMQQISHELKTPLQAIRSAHDVLKVSTPNKPSQERMFDVIDRGVDKIADFSQQYLDLTKIESGKMQYNMEETDLVALIESVVNETTIIARAEGIDIEFYFDAIPLCMMDKEKMLIVINNLITNAIKYTPENGEINVSVSPSGHGVQIKVQDSGIGISSDEIANVFTRFYQAGPVKKEHRNGSGLGLTIVKAYVEGHGGTVSVESHVDQGSIFSLELPVGADQSVRALESKC